MCSFYISQIDGDEVNSNEPQKPIFITCAPSFVVILFIFFFLVLIHVSFNIIKQQKMGYVSDTKFAHDKLSIGLQVKDLRLDGYWFIEFGKYMEVSFLIVVFYYYY